MAGTAAVNLAMTGLILSAIYRYLKWKIEMGLANELEIESLVEMNE